VSAQFRSHDESAASAGGDGGPGLVATLVERIRAGDSSAESELVERFSRGLLIMLRHLTRNPALADDLHQETLALVLDKIRHGQVREPERLAGFIRSTARNLFIADRRREARYCALEGGEDEDAPLHHLADHQPAALDQALVDEEARQVRRLLAELRFERDRQLLIRFYLADASREEICGQLGIDPERFNQVLHRARERLREAWERTEKRRRFFSGVRGLVRRSEGGTAPER
jgi:RNA polymerase sigma-70 factor (ECF subfamily)